MVIQNGSDRRAAPRAAAFFAVEISSPAKRSRCGVTRDASDRGLLVVTPSRFSPAEALELTVHVNGLSTQLRGRVVRVDENPPTSPELWRYRLGIALEEPLPSDLLDRVRDQAATLS